MSVETKQLNCINCPMGCLLTVTLEDGKVVKVEGNTCPRGETYAHQELTDPQRMLTSTVRVEGGALPLLPVVSKSTLPKAESWTVQKHSVLLPYRPLSRQAMSSCLISSALVLISSPAEIWKRHKSYPSTYVYRGCLKECSVRQPYFFVKGV